MSMSKHELVEALEELKDDFAKSRDNCNKAYHELRAKGETERCLKTWQRFEVWNEAIVALENTLKDCAD